MRAAATGTLSAAKGSYPRPRSGAEAGRTPCPKGSSQEDLPHVRGHGQQRRVPGCNSAGMAEKSYPIPRSVAAAERSHPASEVRGDHREDLPPRPHAGGQGRWPEGSTPRPRSRGCAGAGGPRYCVCYPVKHLSALKTLFHYDTFRSTWAKLQKSTLFSDLNAKKQHSVQFEQ